MPKKGGILKSFLWALVIELWVCFGLAHGYILFREDNLLQDEYILGPPLSEEEYKKSLQLSAHTAKQPFQQGYFEGDILPTPTTNETTNRRFLKGLHLWTNGIVPYIIENTFTHDERLQIARAFAEIESVSCVRFVPRYNQFNYLYIQRGKDCASHVGRIGRGQPLSLAPQCTKYGIILHELMHTLGFWHEQSRYDRSDYVDIHWTNIQPLMLANFIVNPHYWMSDVGLPYDYNSILHYAPDTFSKSPSRETITPKQKGVLIGQRVKLSELNIKSINLLYTCDELYEENSISESSNHQAAFERETNAGDCLDLIPFCWTSRAIGACWWGDYFMRRYCRETCHLCY